MIFEKLFIKMNFVPPGTHFMWIRDALSESCAPMQMGHVLLFSEKLEQEHIRIKKACW